MAAFFISALVGLRRCIKNLEVASLSAAAGGSSVNFSKLLISRVAKIFGLEFYLADVVSFDNCFMPNKNAIYIRYRTINSWFKNSYI